MTDTHGERVRASIVAKGLELWRADPATPVSARAIGTALGMSHGAVLYHYSGIAGLRDALAVEAVRIGDTAIVPMLITSKHAAAAGLSSAERRRYLAGC